MANQENYIDGKIVKYQNNKALVELRDKLQKADTVDYAKLHSKYSKIAVVMCDYSGEKSISVSHNIDPDKIPIIRSAIEREIVIATVDERLMLLDRKLTVDDKKQSYIIQMLNRIAKGLTESLNGFSATIVEASTYFAPETMQPVATKPMYISDAQLSKSTEPAPSYDARTEYCYSEDKLLSHAQDDKGYSVMTKLTIQRMSRTKDGEPRRLPWIVKVENGKAIPEKNANGGTMAKKGSYKKTADITITMGDEDVLRLFTRTESYIRVWETAMGCGLIRAGMEAIAQQKEERKIAENE